MSKLSIIIPTWNTADITIKCIEAINKFLPKDFFELIIVDNSSTDNTVSKIKKLIHSLKIKNCKLKINSSNLGFSKANNIGAKIAVGDYLLFLNSDMELIDPSLIKMIDYLKLNPKVGLIGPQFLNPNLTIQGSVLPPQTPLNALKEYWLGSKGSYTKYYLNNTSSVNSISGGAILIKKEIFDQISGWDERYFFYYEDLELCRQVKKIGKEIIYFPESKVIHRHGASGTAIVDTPNQWRRLVPSSILYHGKLTHYLIISIIWTSQKWQEIFGKKQQKETLLQ